MITRIVKLKFKSDKVQDFLTYFDGISHIVNNFPGCIGMKLYQDVNDPRTIMTYSHWNSENDLDNYRNSDAFGEIWPTIKVWFEDKPEAWTVKAYFNGFDKKQPHQNH